MNWDNVSRRIWEQVRAHTWDRIDSQAVEPARTRVWNELWPSVESCVFGQGERVEDQAREEHDDPQ